MPTKIAAQLELGQSIGPVGHRRPADGRMQSEWADHHLSHLIGNQCLYITKVSHHLRRARCFCISSNVMHELLDGFVIQ